MAHSPWDIHGKFLTVASAFRSVCVASSFGPLGPKNSKLITGLKHASTKSMAEISTRQKLNFFGPKHVIPFHFRSTSGQTSKKFYWPKSCVLKFEMGSLGRLLGYRVSIRSCRRIKGLLSRSGQKTTQLLRLLSLAILTIHNL